MNCEKIFEGSRRTIFALCKGSRPIFEDDILAQLTEERKRKVAELIKFLADAPLPITNKHLSRKLEGFKNLHELKPDDIRIFYFFGMGGAVLVSACMKKSKKTNQQDMRRADKLRYDFLAEK